MDTDRSYRRMVLLIACIGALMAPLDSTIVSVSIPTIASSLNMDYASIIWVPTSYLVALAVLILSMGRLSDIRGRKPIFVMGFVIFVVGSFLCSIAQSGAELIVFRIMQGIGAAFFGATATAIVTDVFPRSERGKALGINAMAVYIGLSAGPPLGGILTQAFGWQSIFYINIPIGILVIVLATFKMKESVAALKKEKFDLSGLFTFSIGLIALLVALTVGDLYGWTSVPMVSLFLIAVAFLTAFYLIERRLGCHAMLDITLIMKNKLFASANITALLNYTSFFGVSFMISFYLQKVLGLSVLDTGLILLIMPMVMAILSPVSGLMSDRIGSKGLSSVGMALIGAGLLWMSMLTVSSDTLHVIIGLLTVGVGMGIFASPNTSAVMGSVKREQLGVASGTLSTMRFVGQASSLAMMGAIVSTIAGTGVVSSLFIGIEPTAIASEQFVTGMSYAFIVSALIAFLGAATSLTRGSFRNEPECTDEAN